MVEQIIRWNIAFKLDKAKLELTPSAVRATIIEWQITRIFAGGTVHLFDSLWGWDMLIRDADIKPYIHGSNPILDTMLKSVWLEVIAIVDNEWNSLVEIRK